MDMCVCIQVKISHKDCAARRNTDTLGRGESWPRLCGQPFSHCVVSMWAFLSADANVTVGVLRSLLTWWWFSSQRHPGSHFEMETVAPHWKAHQSALGYTGRLNWGRLGEFPWLGRNHRKLHRKHNVPIVTVWNFHDYYTEASENTRCVFLFLFSPNSLCKICALFWFGN